MASALKAIGAAVRRALDFPSDIHSLKNSALVDLERRAYPGAFVYLPCWIAITYFSGLATAAPVTANYLGAVLAMMLILRIGLHIYFERLLAVSEPWARGLLLVLILAASTFFGFVVAASLYLPELAPALYPLIVVNAVLCTGATLILAIDPMLRYGLPAVMLLPFMAALAGKGSSANLTFSALVLVNMLYLVIASKHAHVDYWDGLRLRAQLQTQSALFEKQSLTDGLTGIHNRLSGQRRLEDEWARAVRSRWPLTAMLIDIDHFKQINDTYGHPFGDECLIAIAHTLQAGASRGEDFAARFGGEEFLILLPSTPSDGGLCVAERLRASINDIRVNYRGTPVPVTCSIGLATIYPEVEMEGPSLLLERADKALYLAKQKGRNRVEAEDYDP
ncbi:GGDEF domain-containing protein [Pseudomonas typographi]|uniref:diguanylate cyclase n=1 Tax=Pseudomonas typographi TaxID=2715964 RepID=A0ABR7ZA01_9PSED|nr:GGDEF domain-containing protein [Pseudomonas typographi]MBD1602386.1 GGDEF domain-containing protein [Pseudomonas typographi]